MDYADDILKSKTRIEHGGKDTQFIAEKIVGSLSVKDAFKQAKELANNTEPCIRMVATYMYGVISSKLPEALEILKENVSIDKDWRVQEILAQAFDRYCKDKGYKASLSIIKKWLKDKNPNVRRAVTEGLRKWTTRDYFKANPKEAILLLSKLKDDQSEYVRRSVGNALRDISRTEKDLIREELKNWDKKDERIKLTYSLASKFLN